MPIICFLTAKALEDSESESSLSSPFLLPSPEVSTILGKSKSRGKAFHDVISTECPRELPNEKGQRTSPSWPVA